MKKFESTKGPHKLMVDIRPMKKKCLSSHEPLRRLMMEEPNKISVENFIEKIAI